MTNNTDKAYEAYQDTIRELKSFPLSYSQILHELICPEFKTLPQLKFLCWLTESDDYYVKKLINEDVLNQAKYRIDEHQRGFAYANHDCDWRAGVCALVMEYVPVRVWVSYRYWLVDEDKKLRTK